MSWSQSIAASAILAEVGHLNLLSDFIYGDVPYFPGPERSSFQKRYRQTFASPEVHELAETVPIMAIYDDHDLGQNDIDTGENNPVFAPAKEAYLDYFGDANPEPVEPGVSYYEYRYGDSAFFVLDTRAYRSPNHVSITAGLGTQARD